MPNLSYLSPKAIVKDSPIHGRGLFARESFTKGEIVVTSGFQCVKREVSSLVYLQQE